MEFKKLPSNSEKLLLEIVGEDNPVQLLRNLSHQPPVQLVV